MFKKSGFSLAEVLMALCIFSFSSIALFKHQWQLTKTLQYQKKSLLAQEILDDVAEFNIINFNIPPKLNTKIKTKLDGTLSNSLYGDYIYTSLKFNNFDGYQHLKHVLTRKI